MIISGSFRKIEKRFFENTPNTDPETAKTLLRGKGSDDMHYYESALALQEETIAHRRFFTPMRKWGCICQRPGLIFWKN